MAWLLEYAVWELGQITAQGLLAGLIMGAALGWMARGDWERARIDREPLPFEEEDTRWQR